MQHKLAQKNRLDNWSYVGRYPCSKMPFKNHSFIYLQDLIFPYKQWIRLCPWVISWYQIQGGNQPSSAVVQHPFFSTGISHSSQKLFSVFNYASIMSSVDRGLRDDVVAERVSKKTCSYVFCWPNGVNGKHSTLADLGMTSLLCAACTCRPVLLPSQYMQQVSHMQISVRIFILGSWRYNWPPVLALLSLEQLGADWAPSKLNCGQVFSFFILLCVGQTGCL